MSTLVLVAHPDDETLFMGGTIAKLVAAGERVQVIALADGVGSRFQWYQWFQRGAARSARADAFRAACEALKVEGDLRRLFQDQRADALQQLDLNRAVDAIVKQAKPYVVYTHFLGDSNIDHRRVAEAVMIATRPGCTKYVRAVYSMAPEFIERALTKWKPTHTEALDSLSHHTKLRACWCYARELRLNPHPRSWQALSETKTEAFVKI